MEKKMQKIRETKIQQQKNTAAKKKDLAKSVQQTCEIKFEMLVSVFFHP